MAGHARRREIFDELEDLDATRRRIFAGITDVERGVSGLAVRLDDLQSVTDRMSDLVAELRALETHEAR